MQSEHTYSNHPFHNPISKCPAPRSPPPSTLPFQTASSFTITAESPFNTVDLPLGQVLDSCLLSLATLWTCRHREQTQCSFSLHVSFKPWPLGSTGFMQSSKLSVVLCHILSHKTSLLISSIVGVVTGSHLNTQCTIQGTLSLLREAGKSNKNKVSGWMGKEIPKAADNQMPQVCFEA